MTFSAGDKPTAAQLDGIALRYIGSTSNNTTFRTATTIETADTTVTFTAGSTSDRYLIIASGCYESSVAADTIVLRIRYKSGSGLSSPPSADTLLTAKQVNADVAGKSNDYMLIGTITGISGQYTFGTTIVRSAGTGTVQINGSSVHYSDTWVLRLA